MIPSSVMLGIASDDSVAPGATVTLTAKSNAKGSFDDVSFGVSKTISAFFEIVSVKVGSVECLQGGPVPASSFEVDAMNRSLGSSWIATAPISVTVRNIDASPHMFFGSIRADAN
jgi:hypothetical protein